MAWITCPPSFCTMDGSQLPSSFLKSRRCSKNHSSQKCPESFTRLGTIQPGGLGFQSRFSFLLRGYKHSPAKRLEAVHCWQLLLHISPIVGIRESLVVVDEVVLGSDFLSSITSHQKNHCESRIINEDPIGSFHCIPFRCYDLLGFHTPQPQWSSLNVFVSSNALALPSRGEGHHFFEELIAIALDLQGESTSQEFHQIVTAMKHEKSLKSLNHLNHFSTPSS